MISSNLIFYRKMKYMSLGAAKFTFQKYRYLHVLRSIGEVRALTKAASAGKKSLGFVPTMGALHHGHIELMRQSKMQSDITVASVFVNPTQFSQGEDLDKYPRTFEKDVAMMETAEVDYVFAPPNSEIYPSSKRLCHVEPADFSYISEGKARPDFFRGVATIVCKLLNIVQPTTAYFGQKDISQCILIRRMVEDLNIPVEIKIIETIRDFDGLAMSSRNLYLSKVEREVASILYKALSSGKSLCTSRKNVSRENVINCVQMELAKEPMVSHVEYVSIASPVDMKEIDVVEMTSGAVISSAIRLGSVRLIDNVLVGRAEMEIFA